MSGTNPVKYVDPTGEFFLVDDFILSAAGKLFGLHDNGILENTWNSFKNSWKMLGHSLLYFPQSIWFAPQETLGLLAGYFAIGAMGGNVEIDGGFKYVNIATNIGAISLGSIAIGHSSHKAHEKGHYYQSAILGPLYIPVIGLPSIVHAMIYNFARKKEHRWNYYDFYTESWAENLRRGK